MSDYGSNTHIVNNLVGTPFEFNNEFDDMAGPGVENLQALRDRRRSFELRTPRGQNKPPSTPTTSTTTNPLLHPVLPGPVDMRTYNLGFEAPHSTASQEAYQNNLLGAFDSGTADQTLSEFNEEDERQFQSALRATGTGSSPSKQPLAATAPVAAQGTSNPAPAANLILHSTEANQMAPSAVSSGAATHLVEGSLVEASLEATSEEVSIDSDSTILHTKTSISDARSQIKLKIKSPLVYPEHFNAMTNSSSLTLSSTMVQSSSTVQATVSTSTVVSASSAVSGNSRRMRKKELLSL